MIFSTKKVTWWIVLGIIVHLVLGGVSYLGSHWKSDVHFQQAHEVCKDTELTCEVKTSTLQRYSFGMPVYYKKETEKYSLTTYQRIGDSWVSDRPVNDWGIPTAAPTKTISQGESQVAVTNQFMLGNFLLSVLYWHGIVFLLIFVPGIIKAFRSGQVSVDIEKRD